MWIKLQTLEEFEATKFHNLFKLVSWVNRYEGILDEEYQWKNSSRGSYSKDLNIEIYSVEVKDQRFKDEMAKIDGGEVMATQPQSFY